MSEETSKAGERQTLAHIPGLDGLRAIAVIGVLLFHGGVSWMPGGFLGVDVFFVLSGYLITALLLRERVSTGGIDLVAFWVRRLRRLLPALLVLVAAVAISAPFTVPADQRAALRLDGLSALAYVANWRFILSEQSYFAGTPSPLRHLWSLAVEEQWYLLFPVVVSVVLARPRRIRGLTIGMAVAALASAVWMAYLAAGESDPSRAYYGTDTRAHTLLVGALLAMVAAQWPIHRARTALAASGLTGGVAVAVAYLFVHETDAWMYQGGFLLLAAATAGVVAAVALPRGPLPGVGIVLGSRPLVAIGRVSYGLYLWHWPVNIVLTPDRTGLDQGAWWSEPALLAVRTLVAVAFTLASYVLVEQPVRRRGVDGLRLRVPGLPRSRAAVGVGASALVVWLLFAATLRAPVGSDSVLAQAEAGVPELTGVVTTVPVPVGEEPGGLPAVPADRPVRAMVTGDSVAFSLTMGAKHAPSSIDVSGRAIIGCGVVDGLAIVGGQPDPIGERCVGWSDYWQEGVSEHRPDVVVLVFGAWEVYDYEQDGRVLRNGSPEMAAAVHDGLTRGVGAALAVDPGLRFLLVGAPCMQPENANLGPTNPARERADPARLAWVNEQMQAFAAELGPRAAYGDLGELLCPGGTFLTEIDGMEVRPDGFHYEPDTTGPTWAWLAERVDRLARTPVAAADVRLPPP